MKRFILGFALSGAVSVMSVYASVNYVEATIKTISGGRLWCFDILPRNQGTSQCNELGATMGCVETLANVMGKQ